MSDMKHSASTVATVGKTTTSSGTASAAATLPTTSGGLAPNVVEVVATTAGHVKFGGNAVAATVNDAMVTSTPRRFYVGGLTHFSVIERTAAAVINIVAVE